MLAPLAGACGRAAAPQKPAAVPAGLVPDSVQNNEYAFFESQSKQVKNAFANAGANSLVADGRLWELRKADRLVGILQMSTLMPEVHLDNKKHRNQVVSQILPAVHEQIIVGDIVVFTSTANSKTVYLWFGRDMFNLLTIKPGSEDHLDAEGVLTEVLDNEARSKAWKPLYIDDGADL